MARRATTVTRTRIQAVALALFATRGYEATSLPQWPWPPVRGAGPNPHRFRRTGQNRRLCSSQNAT